MQVRKQQLELDMEQQTGSKSGKEYVKVVHCYPVYLTMCRVHHEKCWLDEAQIGIRLLGEVSITSDRQMIPRLWQKVKRNYRAS